VYCDKSKKSDGNKFYWHITPVGSYNQGFALINTWNTWLYAAYYKYNYDSSRRRVFMWLIFDELDKSGEWVFEPVPNSSNYYIKSKDRNEYLYPYGDKNSKKNNRPVFTWIPMLTNFGPEMEWVIEVV
jgi:hypothetical protein